MKEIFIDNSDDRFHDKCGVVAVYVHPKDAMVERMDGSVRPADFPAANYAYLALHSMQHRGQESAGIVSSDMKKLTIYRQMGLVNDIFNKNILKQLVGRMAIGHVRYSTAGDSSAKNAQPFLMNYWAGQLAIAHNGNLTNALAIRDDLELAGHIFQSNSDTEVILHLVAKSKRKTVPERVADALSQVEGAFSVALISENALIVARDIYGFRPLCIGKFGTGSYIISSESCVFSLVDAEFVRDVEPGELIVIDENGTMECYFPFELKKKTRKQSMCIFEWVYFARPDSVLSGLSVYKSRFELGRQLARETRVEADMVIPVPDSGVVAAMGYAYEAGIPFELGLIRNHYVGRTFIEPAQSIRQFGVRLKLSPVKAILEGKRVVVIDDSIVRGTTSGKIINMVRSGGAKEVHMRITCPPIISPCYYGIDTPTKEELIASTMSIEEINKTIGSDTLAYISLDGMKRAIGGDADCYCDACFSRNYPLPAPVCKKRGEGDMFERKTKAEEIEKK